MTFIDRTFIDRTFIDALCSTGPAADRTDAMQLYAFLVGGWRMDATVFADDGTRHQAQGEIHASWALQGRAIQDVWSLPGFFYGTTLRIYDPGRDAWHILWSDPLKQYYARQVGRPRGKDIVQDGRNDAGEDVRWSFTEITPHSFRWLGERVRDGAWQPQAEMLAQRVR